jgi:hypothetical protein
MTAVTRSRRCAGRCSGSFTLLHAVDAALARTAQLASAAQVSLDVSLEDDVVDQIYEQCADCLVSERCFNQTWAVSLWLFTLRDALERSSLQDGVQIRAHVVSADIHQRRRRLGT